MTGSYSAPVAPARIRAIAAAAEAAAGLKPGSLFLRTRKRPIAWTRQVVFVASRDWTGASLSRIGAVFGLDHTTVLHGLRAAEARPDTARLLAEVSGQLASRSP